MRSAITVPATVGMTGLAWLTSSAVAPASAAGQFPPSQWHTTSANCQNGAASTGAAFWQICLTWARSARARPNWPKTARQAADEVSAHTRAAWSFPAAARCWVSKARASPLRPRRSAACAAWPRAATRDSRCSPLSARVESQGSGAGTGLAAACSLARVTRSTTGPAPLTGWSPRGWSGWEGPAEPGSESATPLGYEPAADLGISLLGLHARFGQTVQTWPGSPLGRAVDLSLPGRHSLAPSLFADWPGLSGEGRCLAVRG